MSSQARILANRLNAQKSTGPRTPEGKEIVAQNALNHGLSARHDVITTESQEEFDLHRVSLLDELDPQTPMESMLADRIVSLSWRLKRADLIQNQTFDAMHEEKKSNPFPALPKFLAAAENQDPALILGRLALNDFSNARVLDRLLMYERRIEHSLYKTLLELQRLRLIRNLNPSDQISTSNQPEPAAPRLAPVRPRRMPGGCTEQNNAPETAYLAPVRPQRMPGGFTLHASRSTKYAKQTQFPNPQKSPQPLAPEAFTPISSHHQPQKTNPNKPNSRSTGRHPTYDIRKTNPIKPNLSQRSPSRSRISTQSAIRSTHYAPRTTQHAIRLPGGDIPHPTCDVINLKSEI